ncbi:MAG: DUF2835 domain-containing protein [Porticoccaceae bacterium]|nr:DUF2835 domain-containing protein [Porticoccaceae bacterium]OUS04852.1 hypothetical protein A9Q90_07165 [Gammaproteobacteria bacterium 54_18_T64]
MPNSLFYLNISAQEYLRVYQGSARQVVVRGTDGTTLSFPAQHLRRFVSHDGVQGRFMLNYDAEHKFVSLQKLG